MPERPAFPVEEITRHITDPGITATEYAAIAFMAAEISRSGMASLDASETSDRAHRFATATLTKGTTP